MRLLVTGGSSFIGRALIAHWCRRGHDVTAFQRRPVQGADGRLARQVLGDITDPQAVARACAGQDRVVHLAARVGVVGSWEQFLTTNVAGTRVLLRGARDAGVGGFVHVSSPSVAHSGSSIVGGPAAPADPGRTRGHYATSKALAEQIALDASSPQMPVVAIRPHLVWGPGDEQLVGRIVQRARQRRLALVGSGLALIDTTYVDNAATALMAAADRVDGLGGRAFVVSNGQPRTVQELVARFLAAAGVAWTPRRVPLRMAVGAGGLLERVWPSGSEPPLTRFVAEQLATAHWFDQRATRQALDWTPHISLEQGFAELGSWFRQRR